MKTLTVTAARQNLGVWLKKNLQGEDIGVMIDGAIVAFRPVKVFSEDYAEHEYGATPNELCRANPQALEIFFVGNNDDVRRIIRLVYPQSPQV